MSSHLRFRNFDCRKKGGLKMDLNYQNIVQILRTFTLFSREFFTFVLHLKNINTVKFRKDFKIIL